MQKTPGFKNDTLRDLFHDEDIVVHLKKTELDNDVDKKQWQKAHTAALKRIKKYLHSRKIVEQVELNEVKMSIAMADDGKTVISNSFDELEIQNCISPLTSFLP